MKLLIFFIILNVLNVIIQTVKSIATIKCGKAVAALVNAIAYGLYTVVVVYTVCELPLWLKVLIVAFANLIGVYVVKLIEEKSRKEKLWEIRAAVKTEYAEKLSAELSFPHNYFEVNQGYTVFNIYSENSRQSGIIKELLEEYSAKYFVSESKIL